MTFLWIFRLKNGVANCIWQYQVTGKEFICNAIKYVFCCGTEGWFVGWLIVRLRQIDHLWVLGLQCCIQKDLSQFSSYFRKRIWSFSRCISIDPIAHQRNHINRFFFFLQICIFATFLFWQGSSQLVKKRHASHS